MGRTSVEEFDGQAINVLSDRWKNYLVQTSVTEKPKTFAYRI